MKKYYINIRNSKKGKMFDLLELAMVVLAILLLLVLLLISPWYLGIFCAFLAGMLSWLMVPSTVYALSNCIYVDDEKIILKKYKPNMTCQVTGEVSDNNFTLADGKLILSREGAEQLLKEIQENLHVVNN